MLDHTVLCCEVDHDVVDALLHPLEAAHVDVGVVLLEQLPQLLLVQQGVARRDSQEQPGQAVVLQAGRQAADILNNSG